MEAEAPVAPRRAAWTPDADRLRAPYPPRAIPVVVSRAVPAPSSAYAPVDSEAIARGIRAEARHRAVALAIASASVLLAAGTLLAVLVWGAA